MTTTPDPWPDRLRNAGITIVPNIYLSGYVSYTVFQDGRKVGTWRTWHAALVFAKERWSELAAAV